MSVLAIVCLSAIIVAFVLFAAVLAWGDYQTRDITHPTRKAPQRQDDAGRCRCAQGRCSWRCENPFTPHSEICAKAQQSTAKRRRKGSGR